MFGQTRPLIGVGGIVHETNTFNPKKTGLAEFEQGIGGADGILRGKDLIAKSAKANNTTAATLRGFKAWFRFAPGDSGRAADDGDGAGFGV